MENRLAKIVCAAVCCGFLMILPGCGPKEELATFDPAAVKKDTRTLKDLPPDALNRVGPRPSGVPSGSPSPR